MFFDHRFDYMPKGSFSVGGDIRSLFPTDVDVREIGNGLVVYFLQEVSENLKKRFVEDAKKYFLA